MGNAGMSHKRSFMAGPVQLDYTPASRRSRFAGAVFSCPAEVGRRDLGQVAREV